MQALPVPSSEVRSIYSGKMDDGSFLIIDTGEILIPI